MQSASTQRRPAAEPAQSAPVSKDTAQVSQRQPGFSKGSAGAWSQSGPWDNETCRAAAEGGHLAVLQWARRQGCPWDRERCMFAVMRHAHVCAWIGA